MILFTKDLYNFNVNIIDVRTVLSVHEIIFLQDQVEILFFCNARYFCKKRVRKDWMLRW